MSILVESRSFENHCHFLAKKSVPGGLEFFVAHADLLKNVSAHLFSKNGATKTIFYLSRLIKKKESGGVLFYLSGLIKKVQSGPVESFFAKAD